MDRQPSCAATAQYFRPTSSLRAGPAVARGDHYESNPINTGREPAPRTCCDHSGPGHRATHGARQTTLRDLLPALPRAGGDGNGIVKKYGYGTIRSIHEKVVVQQPDGEIFNTITYGKSTMFPYGSQLSIEDRWAVVSYVRALQRSRLSTLDEVPEQLKAGLK